MPDAKTANAKPTRRVLVVDDSETIRRSAEIFLKLTGMEVILATDGFDALAKISDFNPDLILVDIMMPKLDGYQVYQIVKQHPAYGKTPVIMLSSKDGVFDRARGRIAGSDQVPHQTVHARRLAGRRQCTIATSG